MSESEIFNQKLEDLERRVLALEGRARKSLWEKDANQAKVEADLLHRYGERVDKTQAANILGVTRATVYAMIEDGRITSACGGKKVDVRSIAHYLTAPKTPAARTKGGVAK